MTQQRPGGVLLVAIGSVLAVLGASAAVFVFYGARTAAPNPDSARWFADAATWMAIEDVHGEPVGVSSLVGARGTDPVGTLRLETRRWARGEAADHPGSLLWTTVLAIRLTNGGSLNAPQVYLASDEGVSQLVGGATISEPVAFDPPIQVLPAVVETGVSWSQEGIAALGPRKVYDYRVDSEILDVDADRCVEVRASTTLTATNVARDLGGDDSDNTEVSTYCPGRWQTGSTSSDYIWRAVTAPTARGLLAGYPAATVLDVAAPTNRRRGVLQFRDAASVGGADTLVVPESQAVVDSDLATSTVSGLVWTREQSPLWRLVGEGPTVVAPVLSGNTVVVADTHGVVTALDATSGFVLWQERVGRLPRAVALDAHGLYVAVLDRSGSAELLTLVDGERVTTVDAEDDPVGIAVLTDDAGPLLLVADTSSVRGYRADGEQELTVEDAFTAGPVVVGQQAYAGTDDGRLVSIEPDGDTTERAFELDGVTDVLAGSDTVAVLDGDHLHLVAAADLAEVATVADDADALTLGRAGGADVFTTTAIDGRITTYSAAGEEQRTVRAPLQAVGLQLAAATSWDGVVWASVPFGVMRWEAP